MTRILGAALALVLMAGSAFAGSYSINLAGSVTGPNFVDSGGVRTTETSFGEPYTSVRCPSTGCTFTYNMTYPLDITTDGFNPQTTLITPPGAVAGGNVCFQVCFGVVKPGQSWSDLAITTSCQLMATYSEPPAGVPTFISGSFVHPLDTQGVPCTPATCKGHSFLMQYSRMAVGDCPGGTTDDVDFVSTSLEFH